MAERSVRQIFKGQETYDGAGVRLTRVFGFGKTEALDPFLLFDAFGAEDPEDYMAGFPWHPHRGIETVTYMLAGSVRHGDSLGNSGVIGAGDLQWMTAGSGIIHEEMPIESPGGTKGFQLWVNLARSEKMCDPAYRGATKEQVPLVKAEGGVEVLVLAGEHGGASGPIVGVSRSPTYLELRLAPGGKLRLDTPAEETAFIYVFEGSLARAGQPQAGARAGAGAAMVRECLLFNEGDHLLLEAGAKGARAIFARGLPLREPVAWHGPIVMNTQEELELAFKEYQQGTFIKKRR